MAKGEIISMRDAATNFARPTEFTHKEVHYTIDGSAEMIFFLPLAEFTPQKAQEVLGQKVREWAQTVGKSQEA